MRRYGPDPAREGFALPVALLAMMVVGALVTGGFYASSQESRISVSADVASQAFHVAEYGLNEKLGTWRNRVLMDIDGSETYAPEPAVHAGQELGSYTIGVRRLGHALYMVTSEGAVQAGNRQGAREVAVVVRTREARMPVETALAVFGGLSVGGSSLIRGNDNGGPGCMIGDSVPGVTAFDSTLVDEGNKERIFGDPPLEENTTLTTTVLSQFGDISLAELIAMATRVYEPGETENGMAPVTTVDEDGNEICDTSIRSNWGDPDRAGVCGAEFPIIHAKGDLHLKTGTGQGVLIVEGDMHASGNYDFYGVVIVLGELKTTGTGNHIEGSVIVQGAGVLDSESTTLGNSLVQYSRCRVEDAFNGALRPVPLAGRSWTDLTASISGG